MIKHLCKQCHELLTVMCFFFFFFGQWPRLNLFRVVHSIYRGLSYSSHSGQLECLLGTTSKWYCFTCTYDSSLLTSNISCPQRLYPSSHDLPSGCPSPLPNFFNHTPHTANIHTETGNPAYRLRAPSPSHRHHIMLVHPV